MKMFKKAGIALLGAALGCCMFSGCISSELSVTYMVDGETYRVQDYAMNTQISLPNAPTKEGYTFIGWYTDEACTIPYAEGSVTTGLTLYAKFSVSSVYIIVNTAGGEKIEAIEVVPNGDYTVPAAVKEGYTFLGYTYIDENGEEKDFPLSGKYPSTEAIRITAKYAVNKYTVEFDGVVKEVEHGSVAIAPATDRLGYDFVGWYTSETEQTDATKFDVSTPITSDLVLYGKYTPKTFTITVNGAQAGYVNPLVVYGENYTLAIPDRGANYEFVKFTMNGKDFPATGTYTWTEDIAIDVVWDGVGKDVMFFDGNTELVDLRIETEYEADISDLRLPAVPQKTGYTTDGKWYTDAECTTEFVANGTITSDIRLYAKYTANEYTVTFTVWDATTKTMKNVPVAVTYGQVITGVPEKASRDSYDFLGYYNGNEAFDINQAYMIAGNIIVEEKWQLKANASLFEYNASGNYFTERADYDSAWTYVYLIGQTYTFADGVVLSMATAGGDAYATVNGNTLTAKSAGEFVVQVNNNGNIYTRTIKTVEYIQSLSMGGTAYDTAWGLNAEGTDYKRNATDVWDKKVSVSAGEVMKVGAANFIPEININGKVTAFSTDSINVSVMVDGEITNDYNVANGAINFGASLVGKQVAVTLSPKYAVNVQHKAVYNVVVNNALNVYSNDDLKAAFANTSVTEVNILRDIKAELSADQKHTFTWNGQTLEAPINGTGAGIGTGVYTRASGSLKLNGNYFTVDGSKIPLVDCRDSDNHLSEAFVMQNVHFSIFNFGTRGATSYDTYQMENLNVIGNGNMDATAKSGYLVDGKEVLVYSGAAIGIQIGSGTLNMDGVTSRLGSFAVNAYGYDPIVTQDGTGYTHMVKMSAKDCKFENSWANNIYVNGFASVTLDSCYVGVANGAAIHFDSKAPTLANGSAINVDCELNLVNDTDIQNWVIGTEAWFTAYNATPAVTEVKTSLEGGVQQVAQMLGVARTVVNADSKVNFAVLMKTVGENSEWVNDNVGVGSLNLNVGVFDAIKLAGGDMSQAYNIGCKYAKFGKDASALGFGYIEGLVEIING